MRIEGHRTHISPREREIAYQHVVVYPAASTTGQKTKRERFSPSQSQYPGTETPGK